MKIVFNKIIPSAGYKAMCLWPFIFVRSEARDKGKWNETDERHERIHGRQQTEMLLLPFYIWYALEWVVRLFVYFDGYEAYRNISFEQEAYTCEHETGYINSRRHYAWVRFLGKTTYRRHKRYTNN